MMDALHKIQTHAAVLAKGRPLTKEEGEHFVRHFKGLLAGVGELIEEQLQPIRR